MEIINILCGLNAETFNVKGGNAHSNYSISNPYVPSACEEVPLRTVLVGGRGVVSDAAATGGKINILNKKI